MSSIVSRRTVKFYYRWPRVYMLACKIAQTRSFKWVSILPNKMANGRDSNDAFYDMLPKDRMQWGTDEEWRGGVKPQREYTQQELVGIVRHMQTLALLRPPDLAGAMEGEEEQVDYLKSAIEIAEKVFEVDTTGVEPLYNFSETQTTYLRQDIPIMITEEERDAVLKNSQNTKNGYFVTPPIPASKASH